jgi:hypothetical protein
LGRLQKLPRLSCDGVWRNKEPSVGWDSPVSRRGQIGCGRTNTAWGDGKQSGLRLCFWNFFQWRNRQNNCSHPDDPLIL